MPIRKISNMLIDDICGTFHSLATLSLASNEIRTIENLERLAPSLTKLDLSRNLIEPVPMGLEQLTRLVHLDLSHNRLVSLAGLEQLLHLEVVHAGGNLIERSDGLRSLAYLATLHTLTLEGNPIARGVAYRVDVARRLPTLQMLDGEALQEHRPPVEPVPLLAAPEPVPPKAARAAEVAARIAMAQPPLSPSVVEYAAARPLPPTPTVELAAARPLPPTPQQQLPGRWQLPETPPSLPHATPPQVTPPQVEHLAPPLRQPQWHSQPVSTVAPPPLPATPPRHVSELSAAEHRLSVERSRHEREMEQASAAHEAALREVALSHVATIAARDEENDRLTWEVERLGTELKAAESEGNARMASLIEELAREKATTRQLRAYVSGLAAKPAQPAAAEESKGAQAQTAAMVVAGGAGVEEQTGGVLMRAERELEPRAGGDGMAEVGDEMSSLRENVLSLGTEKELLAMRLDAMGRLLVLQEEAMVAGLDTPSAQRDDPTDDADSAYDDSRVSYDDSRGRGRWPSVGAEQLATGEAGEDVPSSYGAAVALVRGWRVKAGELLLEGETARAAHRTELAENLSALEASVNELSRLQQQTKLIEARLAVSETERTAARVDRDAALADAAGAAKREAAALAEAEAERESVSSLKAALSGFASAHGAMEGRLVSMVASLTPLEDRLTFALGRTQYLARLQAVRAGKEPPAASPPATKAVEAGEAASGSGDASHLRAEVSRLRVEREGLLTSLSEKEAACAARLCAAEETAEEKVREARAAAGRWQADLQEATARADELQVRCDELREACDGLRLAASAAEEARSAHAALLASLQSQAMEQQRRHEAERTSERQVAKAGIEDALERAERERASAAAASEAARLARVVAEDAGAKALAETSEALSAAEAAAREASAVAADREKDLQREAVGLRREAVKEGVARRALEREVTRMRANAERADTCRFEYLETKLAEREGAVASLRKERNALLASLRRQQQLGSPEQGGVASRAGRATEAMGHAKEPVEAVGRDEAEEEEEEEADENEAPCQTPRQTPLRAPRDTSSREATGEREGEARRDVKATAYLKPKSASLFTYEEEATTPPAANESSKLLEELLHTGGAKGGDAHGKRRVLSEGLLDELAELSNVAEQLLAPPLVLGGM